jgi:hypothetical protein
MTGAKNHGTDKQRARSHGDAFFDPVLDQTSKQNLLRQRVKQKNDAHHGGRTPKSGGIEIRTEESEDQPQRDRDRGEKQEINNAHFDVDCGQVECLAHIQYILTRAKSQQSCAYCKGNHNGRTQAQANQESGFDWNP